MLNSLYFKLMVIFENENGETVLTLSKEEADILFDVVSIRMMDDSDAGELCMKIVSGMYDISSIK